MNILHEIPDVTEYVELRITAGLSSKDDAVAKTALSHSIFSVVIRGEHSELIGMGRIIGDGACFFQIVDIAVSPSYQDQALNKVIIGELMDYLNQKAPEGADVILLADVPAIGLYQKYGFEFTYPKSISLCKTIL